MADPVESRTLDLSEFTKVNSCRCAGWLVTPWLGPQQVAQVRVAEFCKDFSG